MFHRTIRLPGKLWRAVKARSAQDDKAIRWVIDDALDAELMQLIDTLRGAGLPGRPVHSQENRLAGLLHGQTGGEHRVRRLV